ncbi:MAG: hypothetical protein GX485_09075 [Clostridiales bacterium]|jgi:hypothetical protein|nr:hypothetical protein [Clostridiales bacterium]
MDIFIEQLIKRKKGSKDILIWVGVLLGIIIILFLVFAMAPVLLLPVLIGLIAAAYFILSSRNIEYEYSVTNSDITIDKIINRRKRKNVLSVDAHDIEFLGKYTPKDPHAKSGVQRINASDNEKGENAWCFTARHPQKGNVFVLFSPNEKVLASIKPFLTRQVAIDAFGRN